MNHPLLNSEETYIDDFGNTRMFDVNDHSTTQGSKFYLYNKDLGDFDLINTAKYKENELKKEKIRCLNSDQLNSLLNLFSHIILFDTDLDKFVWDLNRLNLLLEEEISLNFLNDLVDNGEVRIKLPDRIVEVHTTKKEDLIHVTN